jgi:4-hydroxythreonine-4-phosphate dehydrogenase
VSQIALTCGDPAGVGPELVERWLRQYSLQAEQICPIGPQDWLETLPVPGVACSSQLGSVVPGEPTTQGAKIAWDAMELAAQGCKSGQFSAVVTSPVSKEQLRKVGYRWPGQTEFFAERWGGTPIMAFAGKQLKVVLATWHEPLANIPSRFRDKPDLLDRAVLHAVHWLQALGCIEPRVAVCGLNPHAGEAGILGSEEKDFLNPRLQELQKLHPGVTLCLPGDTVFHRFLEGEFDVAVALYHDQGLIPVKTLEFHTAVNITLGLPFLRTSPDHGTAFSLAGKGIARIDSLHSAIQWAMKEHSSLS